MMYKFNNSPKNIALFIPRMFGLAILLAIMCMFMMWHMGKNFVTTGSFWEEDVGECWKEGIL